MTPTQPAQGEGPTIPPADLTKVHARLGLWLYGLYLACYSAFVGLSAFAPGVMSRRPLGGLNAATLSGLGLIALAFLLALVYMALCRRAAKKAEPR